MRDWLTEILVAIELNAKLFPKDLSVMRTYGEDDHHKTKSFLSDSGSGSQCLEELDMFFPKHRQNKKIRILQQQKILVILIKREMQ